MVVTSAFTGSKNGIVGSEFIKGAPENIAQIMMNAFLILQEYFEIEGYEGNVKVW